MEALLNSFLLLQLIMFYSCENDVTTGTAESLFGFYESSEFVEPGSNDGGVDIQASGGYLFLSLKNDFKFTAELYVPDNSKSNYAKGYTNYEGKWSLENSTVKFSAAKFIVDSLNWNEEKKY